MMMNNQLQKLLTIKLAFNMMHTVKEQYTDTC